MARLLSPVAFAIAAVASVVLIPREAAAFSKFTGSGAEGPRRGVKMTDTDKQHAYETMERPRDPGWSSESYEEAMPDVKDPAEGPRMRCTACQTVADSVRRRFSTVKAEFRLTMEKVEDYHVENVLDDLCRGDAPYVGLLMPNISHGAGERLARRVRRERAEEDEKLLQERQKRLGISAEKLKELAAAYSKENAARRERDPDAKISDEQKELEDLVDEEYFKATGMDKFMINRHRRMRLPFVITNEFGDEREMQAQLKGAIPLDVYVLKNSRISNIYQGICETALGRMDDFGVLNIFRGNTRFKICPMCAADDDGEPAKETKGGGEGEGKKEEDDIESPKRGAGGGAKSGSKPFGDSGLDDADEKFVDGDGTDYEL